VASGGSCAVHAGAHDAIGTLGASLAIDPLTHTVPKGEAIAQLGDLLWKFVGPDFLFFFSFHFFFVLAICGDGGVRALSGGGGQGGPEAGASVSYPIYLYPFY
jgi:hypothetical protein